MQNKTRVRIKKEHRLGLEDKFKPDGYIDHYQIVRNPVSNDIYTYTVIVFDNGIITEVRIDKLEAITQREIGGVSWEDLFVKALTVPAIGLVLTIVVILIKELL